MVTIETMTVMKILILIFGEYSEKVFKGAKFHYDQIKEKNVIRI